MKKMSLFLGLSCISVLSFAQVQRTVASSRSAKTDSAGIISNNVPGGGNGANSMNKRQMIRELDLTREQKIKLKEMRESNKAKQDAISNDDKLTPEQKEAKLRELKKEQAQGMQSILNDDQKAKMRTLRQEMFKKRQNGAGQLNN